MSDVDGDGDSEGVGDGDVRYVPGLSYPKVVVLVLAFCFLGGSIGYLLGTDRPPGEGSVDVGFLTDMRTHHQQAIELALLELSNGENPVVVGFAREVLVRQSTELGLMAAEVEDFGFARTRRPDTAMAWMGAPVPWREMPGLASADDLTALRAASGPEADTLFLELMATHHLGGIAMASHAAEHADRSDVRELAALMAELQRVEVAEYRATAAQEDLPARIPDGPDDHGHG